MELSERVQMRMKEKGWSLADLARNTKIAKGYLWEILNGRAKRPSANTLYEIASALGTSVADLLGRTSETQAVQPESIPQSLREFAEEEPSVIEEDLLMLASLRFRNEQPKTKNDWRYLWESIRRSVRG